MKNTQIIFALLSLLFLAGCSSPRVFEGNASDVEELVGLYTLSPMDPIIVSLLGIPQEKQIDT